MTTENTTKTFSLITLGCKVNQYESASFSQSLTELNYIEAEQDADIVIINSCAVTSTAGAQSRATIRKAIRKNPQATIIITGCYAEIGLTELTEIAELKDRSYLILGNSQKDKLIEKLLELETLNTPTQVSSIVPTSPTQITQLGKILEAEIICKLPVKQFGDRTRTYLRIQDGCESFCTYCIVPFTRGPSRSLPLDGVLAQARTFVDEGYTETVLTGIHIGAWGKDLDGELNFSHLMDVLSSTYPDMHFRISSLEPTEITDNLLSLMQQRDNIFPHLHIPLQSGSNEILERMERNYDTHFFAQIIEKCHTALPTICIGIDILAGFPGETDDHFEEACAFLENLDFCYLHVFPYSARPGTKASEFKNHVHGDIKSARVQQLRRLSDEKKSQFYQSQLGTTTSVQVEGKRTEDGKLRGYTNNYVLVHFDGDDALMRKTVTVHLQENHSSYVWGQLS